MSATPLPPPALELTEVEQRLLDAARRGQPFALGKAGPAELAGTEDPGRCVRGAVLRDLLLGRQGELDPHGVRLAHARVTAPLNLNDVTASVPLMLVNCALPPVTCARAHLRSLCLSGCHMSTLDANSLHTDNDLILRDATLSGSGDLGVVRLLGARIGGQLNLCSAQITNTGTGPAVFADGLHTDDGLSLRDATLSGSGDLGVVRLLSARIGGQTDLRSAQITNTGTGPAVLADGLHTDDDLSLQDATLSGSGDLGVVRLPGTRIGGQLNLGDVRIQSDAMVVDLAEAKVEGAVFLDPALVCPDRAMTTGGSCPHSGRRVRVNDWTYPALAMGSWRQWLHLLACHTTVYAPQPFQHLATVERASGHDANARAILIAQQDVLRRRAPAALGGRLARWRHWLWGQLGRYGYRAHRLVAALLVALAAAGALGVLGGHLPTRAGHHAVERVTPPGTPATAPGTRCSPIEQIGLGIDRGLPMGATGIRARCDIDTEPGRGQAILAALWMLQAALWALATLTIASYTGLIRKPT